MQNLPSTFHNQNSKPICKLNKTYLQTQSTDKQQQIQDESIFLFFQLKPEATFLLFHMTLMYLRSMHIQSV